jgi:hypothetical protein
MIQASKMHGVGEANGVTTELLIATVQNIQDVSL